MPEALTSVVTDHRTRVASDKRGRMRARLLAAIMKLQSDEGRNGNFVIDDVIMEAEVSRGTFYKYFMSLDEAFNVIGRQLADEMTMELMPVYDVLTNPIHRTSAGFQIFQWRAAFDPIWGRFVSRTDHLFVDPELLAAVTVDLENGRLAGAYKFESTKVALDLLIGATLGGIRRAEDGDRREARIFELNQMVLVGLGVDSNAARAATTFAHEHLMLHAPCKLPWWRGQQCIARRQLAP